MNNRITLLALKASDPKTGWLDRQKFAELIVAECVHAVQNRGGMCGALASNWVKEHFGVES